MVTQQWPDEPVSRTPAAQDGELVPDERARPLAIDRDRYAAWATRGMRPELARGLHLKNPDGSFQVTSIENECLIWNAGRRDGISSRSQNQGEPVAYLLLDQGCRGPDDCEDYERVEFPIDLSADELARFIKAGRATPLYAAQPLPVSGAPSEHDEPTHPNHPGHHDGHTCEAAAQIIVDLTEAQYRGVSGAPKVQAEPDEGYRYLVTGYGETDFPEIVIARTLGEVADAIVALTFGDAATASPDERVQALAGFNENTELPWEITFEIGGIEVKKVFLSGEGWALAASGSAQQASDSFGQKVTKLVGEIIAAKSPAWRDSLVEKLIELIEPSAFAAPSPAKEEVGEARGIVSNSTAAEGQWMGDADSAPVPRMGGNTVPCGGCGERDPDKRCIGCGHQFTPPDAPTLAPKGGA